MSLPQLLDAMLLLRRLLGAGAVQILYHIEAFLYAEAAHRPMLHTKSTIRSAI
jgi:hypothetical protein